jgi:hypothetical protein
MVETIFFAFGLLLSASKVKGKEQKNCLNHTLNSYVLCLEFYAWPKSIFLIRGLLLLALKVKGQT